MFSHAIILLIPVQLCITDVSKLNAVLKSDWQRTYAVLFLAARGPVRSKATEIGMDSSWQAGPFGQVPNMMLTNWIGVLIRVVS